VLSAGKFQTGALRAEYAQYRAQLDSNRLAESKAQVESNRYTALAAKGIATQQELDNLRYEVERLQADARLLTEQTLARWQARLRDEQTALADLASEEQRLIEEQTHYTLRAPAAGVLVGFTGWSPGEFVTAGQSLGAVSPDDSLVVETYVSPKDIGLVRVGQIARLQIDAHPYTQWGMLDGAVTSISGNLLAAGTNANVFRVTVRPVANFLTLPNGVHFTIADQVITMSEGKILSATLREAAPEENTATLALSTSEVA
jgi:multidrug resistance efflux pump